MGHSFRKVFGGTIRLQTIIVDVGWLTCDVNGGFHSSLIHERDSSQSAYANLLPFSDL
jgi:hypothetical protein